MSPSEARASFVLKAMLASLVAPGLPCLSAYYVATGWQIVLPDHFGSQVFLTETVLFYLFALPAFWLVYAVQKGLLAYSVVGVFATWPAWLLLIGLPSENPDDPLNPQFFLAPTTAIFGLISGSLFFLMVGKSTGD